MTYHDNFFPFSENEVSAQGVAAGSTTLTANSVKTTPNPPYSNIVYSPQDAKLNYQGGNGGWMPATNNIGTEWLQVGTLFNTLLKEIQFHVSDWILQGPFLITSFLNQSFSLLLYRFRSHTFFKLTGYLITCF